MWWERLAVAPFALQSLLCPSRGSDTILLLLLGWAVGFCSGALLVALCLSPQLRRGILRVVYYLLQETVIEVPRPGGDRLQRYRNQ